MTVFETLTDRLKGQTRFTLSETQRMLVLRDGKIDTILTPGRHAVAQKRVEISNYSISTPRFESPLVDVLVKDHRDLVEEHFFEVRTGPDEIAVVIRNGRAHGVITQDQNWLFWKDAGPWEIERIDVSETHAVPVKLAQRLLRSSLSRTLTSFEVASGKVGVLTIDGAEAGLLQPGTHWFWVLGRKHMVKLVETRWQTHEVTGQEILTKDRVTLRVNLSADYRVTDPLKATRSVKDFSEALHLAVQLAFRRTLGAVTLDALLADKLVVNTEAADAVRAEMAAIGIEVGEIALKDVILPGEMRELLNQVVAAQKEAEANVIRRREETNATRSLLNTAKVMSENPVMLRLKELEALETIAGKVERLTVHNGTEGLMGDIVRLRD